MYYEFEYTFNYCLDCDKQTIHNGWDNCLNCTKYNNRKSMNYSKMKKNELIELIKKQDKEIENLLASNNEMSEYINSITAYDEPKTSDYVETESKKWPVGEALKPTLTSDSKKSWYQFWK